MPAKRSVEVTLITKPGCHLCDDARPVVEQVTSEMRSDGIEVTVEEINMLTDADLESTYREDIPVVLINGRRHAFWRVDPERLRAGIIKHARGGLFRR